MLRQKTKIPEGWRETNLGEVAKIRKGLTYKSSDYGDETDGLVFINLKCIAKGGGFNKAGIKYYKGKYSEEDLINSGDLIIANTDLTRAGDVIGAPLFVPNITDKKMLMSMDVSALDINKNLTNKKFIYYYLLQDIVRQYMRNISSGSTVLHLKVQEIPKFKILLPPLAIQNKIAEILGAVDEEIEKVDNIIVATEKMKDELMRRIFTCGIKHTKFKKTKMGEVPIEWKTLKLRDVGKFTNGKAHEKDICEQGKYIVINSKFISSDGSVMKRSDKNFCPVENGDIAMVMSDIPDGKALAKCFLVNENDKYTLNQRICSIKTTTMNNRFLYYVLNRNRYFLGFNDGVSQTNMRKDEVLDCPVQVPPESEQQEIVNVISSIGEKILTYKKIKNNFTQLKKGLMGDLLGGKKILN
ncbi:MAG: restriction endonuclease subunit S [Patescibacteria group bacterium]